MRHINSLVVIILVGLILPAGVSAQVMNGDFESGGMDWMDSADPGFGVAFLAAGGNPGGFAELTSNFQNPGGRACISQTILCGDPDAGTECTIGFDFRLAPVDAVPGSGRIVVTIDGVESVVVEGPTQGWDFVSYVVPCGVHVVEICLEVDPQYNAWEAGIDNVRSECTGTVGTEDSNWDALKSIYR